jgi:hypothetical protein
MEQKHVSLRKANMYWNILLTSLLDNLNGKTRTRKMGLQGVLTKEKDETLII